VGELRAVAAIRWARHRLGHVARRIQPGRSIGIGLGPRLGDVLVRPLGLNISAWPFRPTRSGVTSIAGNQDS
jgi:hypothetical protein